MWPKPMGGGNRYRQNGSPACAVAGTLRVRCVINAPVHVHAAVQFNSVAGHWGLVGVGLGLVSLVRQWILTKSHVQANGGLGET